MKKKWTILDATVSFLFLVMLITTFIGVIMRYVFNMPLLFGEELARYLLIYIVMLGAIINTRDKDQLSITFLRKFLSSKVNEKLDLVFDIFIVLGMTALVYYGALLVTITGKETTSIMRIPWPLIYSSIPFFSMMILLHYLRDVINYLKKGRGAR